METSMAVFRGKAIRKTIHNNEWWFAITDVVEALTDSTDPRQYIKKMRKRDSGLNSYWGTICTPLRLKALDGKMRKTNCANTEGIFRIIQESKLAAHKGGEVAGKARKDLEQKTRKKVVSPENYLDIPQRRRKQLNEKE
jgi:prophage antirepressor-like protein